MIVYESRGLKLGTLELDASVSIYIAVVAKPWPVGPKMACRVLQNGPRQFSEIADIFGSKIDTNNLSAT